MRYKTMYLASIGQLLSCLSGLRKQGDKIILFEQIQ